MALGKQKEKHLSPIVQAIADAERGTTGEIRVHVSRSWVEKDAYAHAQRLFEQHGMTRTAQRNAVLFYVNARRHKFAIIGDEGIHKVVGQKYWEGLAQMLHEDLQSTHLENAIALAVRTIGITLQKYFPADPEAHNPNELPDDVTED